MTFDSKCEVGLCKEGHSGLIRNPKEYSQEKRFCDYILSNMKISNNNFIEFIYIVLAKGIVAFAIFRKIVSKLPVKGTC